MWAAWHFLRRRGRFLALCGAAVLLTGLSAAYFLRYLAKPATGLVVNFPEVVVQDGRVVFSPKTLFSPAVTSGLRPQADVLLRIKDRPIRGSRDVVEADAGIWSFEPFPVDVQREEGVERLFIRPALTPARIDWLFVLLLAIALGFTAFYLILNLPEDSPSNWIALAALFYLVFTCLKPFYYESFFSNLLIHLGKLSGWLMVFFALYFPFPRGRRQARALLVSAVLALYGAFIVLRMVCFSAWSASGGERWLLRYRFLGQLGNVSDAVAFLLYALLLATAYLRTPRINDRRQLEWLLAGFLIGIPPYFFLDQLPLILGEPPGWRLSLGSFANLFLLFVPLFFLIGLMKHRAFNIRFFVHRYLVYLILAAVIFGFFTVLYEPVQAALIRGYALPGRVAGFLVTALLVLCLLPLHSLLSRLVERLFYRSYYRQSLHYSAALERSNTELRLMLDELNRQNLHHLQTGKVRELKGILAGIARRLQGPSRSIAAGLAALDRRLKAHFDRLRDDPGGRREELERLQGEIDRALQLARDGNLRIREFLSKILSLAGSRPGFQVSVEPSRLLQIAGREIRRRYPGVCLAVEEPAAPVFPPGPAAVPRITCDPQEVVQAVLYAADNAVEAAQDGAAELRLRAGGQGEELFIEIADRGSGIDPLNIKKVLDPFYTTKADHEGLGLYFCRLIVERNAGRVSIRSSPAEGTRVLFLFPADRQAAEPAGGRSSPSLYPSAFPG